jgi:molybdenum cofactor synthesis domain-containing protein
VRETDCCSSPLRAAFLVIGNEILTGKTQDSNTALLAKMLCSVGIRLTCVHIIPDDVDTIIAEVRALSSNFDLVVTSGGIGPTHDDVTVEALAKAFGTTVVIEPSMEKLLRSHFGDRITESHILMARVPAGCDLITVDNPWPTVRLRNVWMLPGIPEIFRSRLSTMHKVLAGSRPFVSHAVFTNIEEADLVPLLNHVVSLFPTIDIGSYPAWNNPDYRTKLTFDGLDENEVSRAMSLFVSGLPEGEPLRTT